MTILIAVASNSKRIEYTLESLSECVLPRGLSAVLVIENGDRPVLKETVLKFLDRLPVVYEFTAIKGKSEALNYGIRKLVDDDEFIIFTDDDIRFNPDWILKYEEAFREHGTGHYYGGSFGVDYEKPPDPVLIPKFPPSGRGVPDEVFSRDGRKIFFGFNWAAHRNDLMNAGLFSGDFGPGSRTGATGQETDMQNRLRESGCRSTLVPGNLVWHYVPADKCSFEWLKARYRRAAIEKYITTRNRGRWVRGKIWRILLSTFRLLTGKRREYYNIVLNGVKVRAFVKEWIANGRRS